LRQAARDIVHAGGHRPRILLAEEAARRELSSACLPAKVLLGRIQHTSRNPAPNPRAEAACLRSQAAFPASPSMTTVPPISSPSTPSLDRVRPHR
jgi:hypothetical protein